MKKFTTYSEIENLCEAMIKDFMKRKHYTNAHCVDIEAFVTEYLGIPIVYETFAEPDPGRIGFLSDGIRPLWVVRGNEKKQVLFPKNTVVLEKYLQTQTEIGRKRFTIAHEGAHFVLSKHIPAQTDAYAAFHSEFDTEMVYFPEMLRESLCNQSGITYCEINSKDPFAMAAQIKALFRKNHVYITSENENDIRFCRNLFFSVKRKNARICVVNRCDPF